MLRKAQLLILTALVCQGALAQGWLDQSPTIFLPPGLSNQLKAQQSFPIFWWNFLVLDYGTQEDGLSLAAKVCDVLKPKVGTFVLKSGCTQDLAVFKLILADWSQDYFLRNPRPNDEILLQRLNLALAKASLPSGRAVLDMIRTDPFESYKDLQKHAEERLQFKFERKGGFFIDRSARKLVLPVQLGFAPFATNQTADFLNLFNSDLSRSIRLIGPHAATMENEKQVMSDLEVVSAVGTALLVLLALAVLVGRRWQLLLIVPPVLLSTAISATFTVLLFGSIHGLTLAFGSGIIGIAIDFGLHSIFNRNYKGIWKANAFGLYTTLAALIVMMFSSIPLLRQIMVFSTLGITSGFLILYAFERALPSLFESKPYNYRPEATPIKFALTVFFVLCAFASCATFNLSLDISQFDFQSPQTKEVNKWLFSNLNSKAPLMHIYAATPEAPTLDVAHAHKAWSDAYNVRYEGVSNYLPLKSEQEHNLKTWSERCSDTEKLITPTQATIFEPFLKYLPCREHFSLTLSERVPLYVNDLRSVENKNTWISMWFPQTDAQAEQVKEAFPGSLSLKEVVSVFPLTLFRELKWMVPISLLVTLLFLFWYYRRVYPSLLCMIPFFCGFGFFALASFLFNFNTSFITIIGLVMVFGLSVDYGIFATDLSIGKKRSIPGVWSALSLSALTATAGFAPLIFCRHPVLLQLGQPLVLGTIGTYIGTVWGIPGCVRFLKAFQEDAS